MRATTRTTLTLGSLLEIPIGIATATGSSPDVTLDTAAPDGTKRVQQYVHESSTRTVLPVGDDGEAGEPEEIAEVVTDTVKGIRVGGELREVPESEIKWARAETKLDAVEVLEFIDYRKVPTDRLVGSYWVQPDPGFGKPLRTLMDGMRRTKKAMVVKFSMRDRQRLGVVRVRQVDGKDALLLNAVAYSADWKHPDEHVLAPANADVRDAAKHEKSVAHAVAVIESMVGDGDTLDTAADELPPLLHGIVENVTDGRYADPVAVLSLAAEIAAEGQPERSQQLIAWAANRWPQPDDTLAEVEAIIASGENVGERLAAAIG